MRSSDYKAANVRIQIALLVDHPAQLAAGPSANRHINIQFLSASTHEATQSCRGCELCQRLQVLNFAVECVAILLRIREIQGSYLGLDIWDFFSHSPLQESG